MADGRFDASPDELRQCMAHVVVVAPHIGAADGRVRSYLLAMAAGLRRLAGGA